MRRVFSHRAEVEGQLRLALALPSVICLNDTLLYEITRDAQLWLTGYCVLSRRNRNDWKKSGGIDRFVLERFIGHVAFLEHSTDFERSWHIIHSDIGPVLFGAWYRPPIDGEVASIHACSDEWQQLSVNFVATIFTGDMNAHHARWLRHSNRASVE